MKKLLALIVLCSAFATQAVPLWSKRNGDNITYSWDVKKSTRYQLRWANVNLIHSFDSCYIGRYQVTIPYSRVAGKTIQLIDRPNLMRCP